MRAVELSYHHFLLSTVLLDGKIQAQYSLSFACSNKAEPFVEALRGVVVCLGIKGQHIGVAACAKIDDLGQEPDADTHPLIRGRDGDTYEVEELAGLMARDESITDGFFAECRDEEAWR